MTKTYQLLYLLLCLGSFFITFGCSSSNESKPIISVTIEPQKYFLEQLADSFFVVQTMVPAGSSPENYDPSPLQMMKLEQSTAYFRIGHIAFEEVWMDKIAENHPNLRIFDNSEGIALITSDEHHECTDHSHAGGVDPHIWSSPREAKLLAQNMCKELIDLDPDHKSIYEANLVELEKKIVDTDSTISGLLRSGSQKSFIIFHPALSYFADYYGLKQFSIEIDGKEPSPDQLARLIDTSRKEGIKTVFIQQEFDQKNAEIMAKETKSKMYVIDLLSYDWHTEMINIAKALSEN
ncbi:zinc ABC transporter substrate-binding protein [Bacteroidales bacterium]|nr:zinc ABC transporter substrate-binding protein [Bacteroidales bacterium]